MLEIKHLETLTAIRTAGSLQEAAELLHVTQSALSHQLRELEARLGVPLLNRRTRPARLTPAALRIVTLADNILPRIRKTEKELQSLAKGESGRLYLAIDCHSCFQWLMPALDNFRKLWPDISLDLSAAFSFAPLPALIRGDLDLVITSDPQELNGIEYTPLFRYELITVLGSQHPLLEFPFLKPEHFNAYTLITYPVSRERLDIFTQFLDHEGIEPAEIRQAELTPMIIQLVASHRGLAALPNWAVDEYLTAGWVQTRPLGAQGVWRTLYAAKRKEDMGAKYVQDFIQQAQETCFEHLHGILPASPS